MVCSNVYSKENSALYLICKDNITTVNSGTWEKGLNSYAYFYFKLKKDIDFTVIGHVTDKSEGNNFITKDNTSHPITAQGWDPIKK